MQVPNAISKEFSVQTLRRAIKSVPQDVRTVAKNEKAAFFKKYANRKEGVKALQSGNYYLAGNHRLKQEVQNVNRMIAVENYMKNINNTPSPMYNTGITSEKLGGGQISNFFG